MPCQLNRVGLAGLLCLSKCQAFPQMHPVQKFAPPGLLGMSGIAFLITLILVIFGLNMPSCLMRHMVPCIPSCGTRIRRLFVL